jgi:hypothetical protein
MLRQTLPLTARPRQPLKNARPFIALALFLMLASLSSLAMTIPPTTGSLAPSYNATPQPQPTPPPLTPTSEGGSVITSITQIFHHLVFPVETISKALTKIFGKATATEVSVIGAEITRWTQTIGDIVQAPKQGDYSKVAQSSLPVAAALASALFLLRLALYHWGRLLGDDDSGLRVVGDWVTAGALAVACGPLLDLIVQLGWWMVGRVIGETGALAVAFVKATTATSALLGLANLTFLGSLITICLAIGALVAIGGLLFAFASANAVLFILAVLGPPLAVISALPQMRWLRSLWLKALTLIAILPIVAGGIFKAGLSAAYFFDKQGLLSAVIRVIWLWGAVGLLLSMAGILSKMTLTTTTDAIGQMFQAVKQVASIAALATSGMGAAGAAAGGGAAASGAGAAVSGSGTEAALGHLNAAQQLTQRAGALEAMGLKTPAAYNRSQAHGHELAARQSELGERMQRFGGEQTQSADFGFSPTVNATIQSNFNGSTGDFRRGFEGLSPYMAQHGLDPNALAAQYPQETAQMVQSYLNHSNEITSARDPLYRAAQLGGANQLMGMLTFRSNRPEESGEA